MGGDHSGSGERAARRSNSKRRSSGPPRPLDSGRTGVAARLAGCSGRRGRRNPAPRGCVATWHKSSLFGRVPGRIEIRSAGLDLDPTGLGPIGLGEVQPEDAVLQLGGDPLALDLVAEDERALIRARPGIPRAGPWPRAGRAASMVAPGGSGHCPPTGWSAHPPWRPAGRPPGPGRRAPRGCRSRGHAPSERAPPPASAWPSAWPCSGSWSWAAWALVGCPTATRMERGSVVMIGLLGSRWSPRRWSSRRPRCAGAWPPRPWGG